MLNRRGPLSAMVATAVGTAAHPLLALASDSTTIKRTGRKLPWRNWSGSQQCIPDARKAPATIAELQELVESGPVPWGRLEITLEAPEGLGSDRFVASALDPAPMSPESLARLFQGVEIKAQFEALDGED